MSNQMNELRSQTYKEVITDLIHREKMGMKKYGTTVDDAGLTSTEWIQHAYEEALDLAIYLKRLMNQAKAKEDTYISREIL